MSTSLALLLAAQGGGAGSVRQYELRRASDTITVNSDGVADIMLIGGSPSGGAAFNGFVGGAGAPGVCIKRVKVLAGQTFAFSCGAGGTAVTRASAGATQGNVGGMSTLTGPNGLSMTANSGAPGEAKTTKPALGGAGGTATGGDLNLQGGFGGSVLATGAPNAAAGAGACNLKRLDPQTGPRGGNVNTTGSQFTSPGAGVGGRGGDITGSGYSNATAGGGYGGPAVDNSSTRGPNAMGELVAASPSTLVSSMASPWAIDYFGGGGSGNTAAGPGGGGATVGSNVSLSPGIFGGISGTTGTGVTGPANAGNVSGGGAIASTVACTSGPGDVGMLVFVVRG